MLWAQSTTQGYIRANTHLVSWCFEPSRPHKVIWGLTQTRTQCFEPSRPHRVISVLSNTDRLKSVYVWGGGGKGCACWGGGGGAGGNKAVGQAGVGRRRKSWIECEVVVVGGGVVGKGVRWGGGVSNMYIEAGCREKPGERGGRGEQQ